MPGQKCVFFHATDRNKNKRPKLIKKILLLPSTLKEAIVD
jgi:hypothetical protein